MADVLAPATTPTTPSTSQDPARAEIPHAAIPTTSTPRPREMRPAPAARISSHGKSRMSTTSLRANPPPSRPESVNVVFPAFPSILPYAQVRDFAYEARDELHYGTPLDPPSGASTPGGEWNSLRRLSDPQHDGKSGGWSTGPWGEDGIVYSDPEQTGMDSLPSTSFGDESETDGESSQQNARLTQRKSKSYANFSEYERGRRRESATGQRRSRVSGGDGGTASDMFHFTGQQTDPAGRETLRQSRSYGYTGSAPTGEGRRRDSHFATTLPSRSFGNNAVGGSALAQQSLNPDTDMPLDAEIPSSPSHSPQRQSIGPEDEELYAGPSLALYSFEPENANELRLTEGQRILVAYRHGQGWLVAEDPRSGEQGLVPEENVRLLSDLPHYDPETGEFLDIEGDAADLDVSDIAGDGTEDMDEEADGTGITQTPEPMSTVDRERGLMTLNAEDGNAPQLVRVKKSADDP